MTTTAHARPVPVGLARWARQIPVGIVVHIISFMAGTRIPFALSGLQDDLHIDKADKSVVALSLGRRGDRAAGVADGGGIARM